MINRSALVLLLAFGVLTPAAMARQVAPLTGKGENIEGVVRVKIPKVNEVEHAGDWAFVSTGATCSTSSPRP